MKSRSDSHTEKLSRINSLASSQTSRKASITSEQLGRRYKLIYESLASKQAPLNLIQIARWFGTQDELVRKSLEKAEPFTWLKHLDKGTSKSSRSSRYLSALIMEEYVHAQSLWGRLQVISGDSPILKPRTGSANDLDSSKSTNLMATGISFEPKAIRTRLDTASRKSADSALSSVATSSSIFGAVPLSPVSSQLNDCGEKVADTHKTFSDTSSFNGSEVSDNSRPRPLVSVPDLSLQPPSSDDVATRHSTNPLSLALASSTGSLESTNPPPVHAISSEDQSLLSLKSSKPRRMSLHASRPGRRSNIREYSEESLRLEYEAKAT